jgi:hypothetical protein
MNWPPRTVPQDVTSRLNSQRSWDARLARWSPEFFRRALRVDGARPRPLRELILDWQERDFAALDPAWIELAGLATPLLPNGPLPLGIVNAPRTVLRRAYFERPRGHSKTFDTAVQVAWILSAARHAVSGVAAASDADQAQLLRQSVGQIARLNPHLTRDLRVQVHRILNPRTGSDLKFIASDVAGSWGHNPDFVICDELCHWSKAELWYSLFSAAAKRPHCVLLVLSNAGAGRGWQWRVRQMAQDSPDWYFSSLDGPCAPWITPAQLEQQRLGLMPSTFERLWLNRWQFGDGGFVTLPEAEACRDESLRALERGHNNCDYLAVVDYAEKHDYTVGCVCHYEGRRVIVDRMDVMVPAADRPTPVRWVVDWTHRMAADFPGVRFVFDAYQLLSVIQELSLLYPIERFEFQSGKGNHAVAMVLRNLICERRVAWYPGCGAVNVPHSDRDDLETELASLIVKETGRGQVRFDHIQDGRHHDDRAFVVGVACVELLKGTAVADFMEVTPPAVDGGFGWR